MRYISDIFKEYMYYNIFQEISRQMEENFLKYWKKIPLPFATTTILDPRAKLLEMQNCLNTMNENLLQQGINK